MAAQAGRARANVAVGGRASGAPPLRTAHRSKATTLAEGASGLHAPLSTLSLNHSRIVSARGRDVATQPDTVTVEVADLRAEYGRVEAAARDEGPSVADALPGLILFLTDGFSVEAWRTLAETLRQPAHT